MYRLIAKKNNEACAFWWQHLPEDLAFALRAAVGYDRCQDLPASWFDMDGPQQEAIVLKAASWSDRLAVARHLNGSLFAKRYET